ncbi:hypothetical protein TGARI_372110 [Toxoplasma gondii ARI]|uniref:Uncharacterized protein n=1 Tax=Toxoplasma gondii ARI TaxID=1074872 RepID=A0A139XIU5_TOXGO|nr:hypothetical protein TGARI_372110 [Toxoplasma gondii ARI]
MAFLVEFEDGKHPTQCWRLASRKTDLRIASSSCAEPELSTLRSSLCPSTRRPVLCLLVFDDGGRERPRKIFMVEDERKQSYPTPVI